MIKKYLRILNLAVICCFLCVTTASARVCFLPDSEDCGQGDTNMPEANSTVIPCDHKDCNDTSWYNKTYEECYKSGVCAYKRCKLTQEECEKTRQKNEKCNYDADTGCYYLTKIDKCSPLYNRTQNDIHGDCKECVDKQGSHWYCQYDNCNDLYPGSSPNPTCTDGTTKKKIGKSLKEGDCYICSTDSSPTKTCKQQNLVAKADCDTRTHTFTENKSVTASDAPCGTCTLKTCKQQGLVAKADCDTKNNTFTENKSVIASNAPCGTCTPKNTPKYDTYTIYAKVKCAGPYEEMDKCNDTDGQSWGNTSTNNVCPALLWNVSTGSDPLGHLYEWGYVTRPSKCADISYTNGVNSISPVKLADKDDECEDESDDVCKIAKLLGLTKDSIASDEELLAIGYTPSLNSYNLKLKITPKNKGNHEVYSFSNYETLSSKRKENSDYEYAFADNDNYISDLTYKEINIPFDGEKQYQYIGSLPTIYPVIRLKSGLAEQSKDANDISHAHGTVVYPPYYNDGRINVLNTHQESFYYISSTHWYITTSLNGGGCDYAYFSFAGASRNILSNIFTGYYVPSDLLGQIDLVRGDVFNYAGYFPSCKTKKIYSPYGPDEATSVSYYDKVNNYMKEHKNKNDRALPMGFKSGYVHKDGAIYIFEDGFDTASNYTELPGSECSTKTCANFGDYFSEEQKTEYEDGPLYTNFQQVTVPCSNLKCYTAELSKCEGDISTGTPNDTQLRNLGIPIETYEMSMYNTWVNSGENEESACKRLQRTLLESGDIGETDTFHKAILVPRSSKKCAVCYYRMG